MIGRRTTLAWLVVPWLGGVLQHGDVATIVRGSHRFLFPAGVRPDSGRALRVLDAVASASRVRGLPPTLLEKLPVLVSLSTRSSPDVDAVSFAEQRLIALPLERWHKWPIEFLERVVRHEVAHIALAVYLSHDGLPPWLSEGFAEWASGPMSCEDETLLRLDVLARGRQPMLRLMTDRSTLVPSRLQYLYLGTFIRFLDAGSAVSGGRLLRAIRDSGVQDTFIEVYGANVVTLERRWWAVGLEQYRGGLPIVFKCPP
jgi:hypothetical protein